MACTLNNILAGAQAACDESFSGVGSRIYIGLVSNLPKKPTKADVDADNAEFTSGAFGSSLQGKLVAWDIEEETGEVTYETNAGGGGFTNKIEVTIRKNMHKVAHDLRILNNVKFFVLVPAPSGGYYVFYSVNGSAKIESATGTTGKASNDEHGHTLTISAGPMYYPMMTWNPGSNIDLDTWASANITETSKTTVTFSGDGFTVSCNDVPLSTGTQINSGSTVVVTAVDGKKLTSVKFGTNTIAINSDNKTASATVSGDSVAITVTTTTA